MTKCAYMQVADSVKGSSAKARTAHVLDVINSMLSQHVSVLGSRQLSSVWASYGALGKRPPPQLQAALLEALCAEQGAKLHAANSQVGSRCVCVQSVHMA